MEITLDRFIKEAGAMETKLEALTKEEYEAAIVAIQAIREKNARLEKACQAKRMLDDTISKMIDLVGIEQTKVILRGRNRELRN